MGADRERLLWSGYRAVLPPAPAEFTPGLRDHLGVDAVVEYGMGWEGTAQTHGGVWAVEGFSCGKYDPSRGSQQGLSVLPGAGTPPVEEPQNHRIS